MLILISIDSYRATIFNGKTQLTLSFTDYDQLIRGIQLKWGSLIFTSFRIKLKNDNKEDPDIYVTNMDYLNLNKNLLVVEKQMKGFSNYKNEGEVLGYLNYMFNAYSYLRVTDMDSVFPSICLDIIPTATLQQLSNYAKDELMVRNIVIDRTMSSEYTMREYISPILIWSVNYRLFTGQ